VGGVGWMICLPCKEEREGGGVTAYTTCIDRHEAVSLQECLFMSPLRR
jgi:hypothetical protein